MKVIALVGGPNTGKSTFFNSILNADEHVGNWHGVTTEFKEKVYQKNGEKIATVTDLPGTYSLSCFSFEEEVTRDYLLSHKDAQIINIIDGNCLQKNLLLTLELLELGFCPVLCINMANELKKSGKTIDVQKLEKALGVKVFLINAQKKQEAKKVFNYVLSQKTQENNKKLPYFDQILVEFQNFFKNNKDLNLKNLTNFEKIKLLELDENVWKKVSNSKNTNNIDENNFLDNPIYKELEKQNTLQFVIQKRFDFIDCLFQKNSKIYGFGKLDKITQNRVWAIPIFLLLVGLIFFFTFGPVGTFLTDKLSLFFEKIIFNPFIAFIKNSTNNQFVIKFFEEAVCGSIGSIVSFLPQIVLMYLGLYFLEDSGYMSRLAFIFEDGMQKVGLSGKSIFTLLMCFGCSTTATLSSRNQENKNSKIKTAMLTPYISCSAKLPIYSVVCGAFFPKYRFFVVIGFYILGITVALLTSYFLNKKMLKSNETNFLLEMSPYRMPSAKKIAKNVLTNVKDFMLRAGTVLIGFSCIVWLLQNLNFKLKYGQGDSILDSISGFLAPIFTPLGFGTKGVVSTLLCGFVAKEIIVSTIGLVNNLGGDSSISNISKSIMLPASAFCLSPASGLSFLVFATLYLPCISTVSVLSKEIGKKWTTIACLIQLGSAYLLSFVTYKIFQYFVIFGALSGLLSVLCFVLISAFGIFLVRLLKGKKYCKICPKRKSCGK